MDRYTENMTNNQNTPEPLRIVAPLAGIWRLTMPQDSPVSQGDVVGYVEAIKLDAAVVAPAAGTAHYLLNDDFVNVDGGDPLAEIQ